MAEDASLQSYLEGERSNGSACWCESAPPKIVEQVNAVIIGGSKQWTAITRWLHTQGVNVTKGKVEWHFAKNHHEKP